MRPICRVAVIALAAILGAGSAEAGQHILFVGNSFTFGATAPVHHYRAESVHDLNGENTGGVPALFRTMTAEAGLDYDVSLETIGGADLDRHWRDKRAVIDRPWDVVVLQSFSTLDAREPGNPAKLIESAQRIAAALTAENPDVALFLTATWARADLVYDKPSPWNGESLAKMTSDIRSGYDEARAAIGRGTVLPVGGAWLTAISEQVADANPYDGIEFNKVDLWGWDHYHASTYGYYLEALIAFGAITGHDPRELGPHETCADDLGISPDQAVALQRVAADTLASEAAATHVAATQRSRLPAR